MGAAANKPTGKTRILVVDDHPLVREGLVGMINRQSDFTCCGEADTVATTYKAVASLRPDLVLLDLWLDGGDGLELIKTMKAQFPSVLVLVLSQFDEALYAERALRAGARGYVMKEQATREVLTAMRTILAGELYVSPKVAALVLHKMIESKPSNRIRSIENLTDRELQVLQLLGTGMSTRKIAAELNLSFKTVETHRENIKHKLGLQGAAELVRYAAEWLQGRPSAHPQADLSATGELNN